jgi:hypothetical protein
MTIMIKESRVQHEHPLLPRSDRNVGAWERAARLFFGSLALGVTLTAGPFWLRALLAMAGTAGLLTSVGAKCPINRALGRNTYHHGDLR